jgi:hypothetical protein
VTFVLTVIVGLIVVPVALYFANQPPGGITVPNVPINASPSASGVPTSPTPTVKATPTPT